MSELKCSSPPFECYAMVRRCRPSQVFVCPVIVECVGLAKLTGESVCPGQTGCASLLTSSETR